MPVYNYYYAQIFSPAHNIDQSEGTLWNTLLTRASRRWAFCHVPSGPYKHHCHCYPRSMGHQDIQHSITKYDQLHGTQLKNMTYTHALLAFLPSMFHFWII